ncbi:MAG: SRPBCC domain-containing protein [Planctomycetota bacterium]|nr:SRPBCC domain-containing protein [Planctomycetota bacterium]
MSHSGAGGFRAIAFDIHIRASTEAVWSFLMDPDKIPRWHNYVRVDVDRPEVGGRFRFICGDSDPDDGGEILELETNRKLSYRWSSSEPEATVVEYHLEPQGEYTKLSFKNSPFKEGPDWDKLYEADYRGWVDLTLKLKQAAEGQS